MNNLTIIASLIGLESRRAQDDARCGFEELEARISSIALIHELLYKGEIGKEIWLDDYLERLCRSVFSTFLPADSPAKLELELAAVSLDVDDTLYLGLIVVELLTNSLKYAIIPRNGGLIRVSLRGLEEGWMELSVADDGPGIRLAADRGAAETSGDSLGQSLVSLLASEIGAELSRGNGPGTLVALLIPQKSK
jgi:two-component sensor histidine kinase